MNYRELLPICPSCTHCLWLWSCEPGKELEGTGECAFSFCGWKGSLRDLRWMTSDEWDAHYSANKHIWDRV